MYIYSVVSAMKSNKLEIWHVIMKYETGSSYKKQALPAEFYTYFML